MKCHVSCRNFSVSLPNCLVRIIPPFLKITENTPPNPGNVRMLTIHGAHALKRAHRRACIRLLLLMLGFQ